MRVHPAAHPANGHREKLMAQIPTFAKGQDTGKAPNTVTQITKLEPYLVEFTDERGQLDTRIFLRVPETAHCFVIRKALGGDELVTTPSKWLREKFNEKLNGNEPEAESV